MRNKVDQLLKKYHGNLSWKLISSENISRSLIYRMVAEEDLEQPYRGLFVGADYFEDTMFLLQQKYGKGLLSHETALSLNELSNVMPDKVHLSFPQGFRLNQKSADQMPISAHFVKKEHHELGVKTIRSSMGNELHVYNKERTLCDVWNPWSKTIDEYKQESLKNYMQSNERDISLLLNYMKKLPIDKKMKTFVEALLNISP